MKSTKIALALFALIVVISANAEADWVDPEDIMVNFLVPSFFAGYLQVNSDKAFYYVYHPSQNNPTKDPVIVWFGSGPGCSSLYSMMYSKGPYVFSPNSTEFMLNKYAWNLEANLVFIQSPSQTGFALGPILTSDFQQAIDNRDALIQFFNKFEHLKDQQLYLAGEGYSGVTVPWIASAILDYNELPYILPGERINLKGLFLGNPCTTPDECYYPGNNKHSYKYLKNHFFYTKQQYENYRSSCESIYTPDCNAVKQDLDNQFLATGANRRNIYENCLKQNTDNYTAIPCLDQVGILHYFNNPQIRNAFHATLSPTHVWQICNPEVPQAYIKDSRASYFLYRKLIRAGLRLWVYSGVMDASNPITGTMKWIEELRLDLGLATLKPWSPWYLDQDVNGGDYWVLRGLTFVSIRSAGHMVFSDEPELGYRVLEAFLKNSQL